MLEKIGMKVLFVCGVAVVVMATVGCGWVVISGIKDDIQYGRKHRENENE